MRQRFPAEPASGKPSLSVLLSLLPYLAEFKGRVVLAIICLLLAKIATVTTPWLLKQIVDRLDATQAAITAPLALLFFYGLLRFASSALGELRDTFFSRVTERSMRRIAKNALQHLHKLDLDFHQKRETGGLSRDIDRGISGVQFLLRITVFNIIPTLFELVMVLIILWGVFNWFYGLLVLSAILSYVTYSVLVTEWRTKQVRAEHHLESLSTTRAVDSLLNYETVKYFNNEDYEVVRYDQDLELWEQARIRRRLSLSLLNIGQSLIIAVFVTVLLICVAVDVQNKVYTLGDFVMINAYMIQLFIPLNILGFVYRQFREALLQVERLFSLLRISPAVREAEQTVEMPEASGGGVKVEFDGVSFSYDGEREILKDVSFTLSPGKTLAIVGQSGAGKSTIGKLLFRFYDPSSGNIKFNGVDIRQLKLEGLRQAIGVVPQEAVLFNDSIEFNIAYGKPGAAHEEVVQATQRANLSSFIDGLAQGYETVVGERGVKISGGEKQRVAIARVLIKDPPILLFDEATSSLDTKGERAITRNLYEVAGRHSTLIIAHRLSTVAAADEILVLKQGQVVEAGTHEQLLSAGGYYQELWQAQSREREGEQST